MNIGKKFKMKGKKEYEKIKFKKKNSKDIGSKFNVGITFNKFLFCCAHKFLGV